MTGLTTKHKGVPQIKRTVNVDAIGDITLKIKDLGTGKPNHVGLRVNKYLNGTTNKGIKKWFRK